MPGYFDDRYGEWVEYEEDIKPSLWTKIQQLKTPTPKTALPKQALALRQAVQPSTPTPLPQPSLNASPGTPQGRAKGGRSRALKLSPTQRTEIARKAADARWRR
jgi:hypothetical protein